NGNIWSPTNRIYVFYSRTGILPCRESSQIDNHRPRVSTRETTSRTRQLPTKNEENRTQNTEASPEIVQPERFFHVIHGEGHEHRERDDFLQDLELPEGQHAIADAVGWHL